MINIEKLIIKYSELFGENPIITKVNVGFTNTIYNINDKFIIKICTNENNRESFLNEIEFYNKNKDNDLIPVLYSSDITKETIPYYYEILQKIDGISLYNIWHNLSEEERENIVVQLTDYMKDLHLNVGEKYDWSNYIKNKFLLNYKKVKGLSILTEEERQLLEYSYSKFDKYLQSDEFVLVHNDLHFDNVFYNNGKIKVIDFERSMYAPRDFELDILYRMIRKPWNFASEETEQYTNAKDYFNILLYLEKYYKELFDNKYLEQRLAIYDIVYYLEQIINYPYLKELKDDIISAAKIVVLKEHLHFEDIATPEELMDYMDINIKYGWIDKFGNKHLNNLKGFRENYLISSIESILKSGVGTCIEQAKLIKLFFDTVGFENKLFCWRGYETEDNFDKEVRMHCFVLYKVQDNWYHFEHSNFKKRGIHKYGTMENALETITGAYEKTDIRKLTEIPDIPDSITFKKFNNYVNSFDYKKN